MRKIIIALMGLGMSTGCYAGIDDSGDGEQEADRGSRWCYTAYYSGTSSSYTSNNKGKNNAETENGNSFTVKVDAADARSSQDALAAVAWNAASSAAAQHALACSELQDIDLICEKTCDENGSLSAPGGVIVCPTCQGPNCGPSGFVQRQLKEKPYRGDFSVYEDPENGLIIQIFEARDFGEYFEAEVMVSGPCSCACDPG